MDILQVLDSYGVAHKRDTGHTTANDVSVCCPFCDNDKDFFGNLRLESPHFFSCWYSSDHSTNIEGFLSKKLGVSYADIKKQLPREETPVVKYDQPKPLEGLPSGFKCLTESTRFARYKDYLESRGLDSMMQRRLASELGMVAGSGDWVGYIIFPFVSKNKTVAFQGRAVSGQTPKYLASRQREGYAPLSDIAWNANNCHGGNVLVIAEGIFDVIKLILSGIDSLALLGKKFGNKKEAALRSVCRRYDKVLYFADNGVAQNDALKIALRLGAELRWPPNGFDDIGDIDFKDLYKLEIYK